MNKTDVLTLIESVRKVGLSTMTARLKKIIEWETNEYRRWKELEDSCGVAANSWQQMFNGKQRPTVEMIEGVAQKWPHYAFWLVTGLADAKSGHGAPKGQLLWPENEVSDGMSGSKSWERLIALRKAVQEFDNKPNDDGIESVGDIVVDLNFRLALDEALLKQRAKKQLKVEKAKK
jgi:hypothetical protein